MARSIPQIDEALRVERAIWLEERRAGRDQPAAHHSLRRLNTLLEERKNAMALRDLREREPGAVPSA